jgi:4-amino-4-deoxy-L-arabinose transferase-like glycosyltransferase
MFKRLLTELDRPERFLRFAARIVATAILLRMAVLMLFWGGWCWQVSHVHDDWNKLAINLVDFGVFGFNPGESTLLRGPIFPILEIPLYLAFGEHYVCWSIALIFLDGGTCLLLMLLARRVWGCRTALLAGFFYSLHLAVAYYVCQIEQFSSMLPLVVAWLCLFALWERDYFRRSFPWVLGIVSGIMILNKTVYLPVVFIAGAALWWCKRREFGGWSLFRPILIYLVVSILVVAPWTLRNYRVSGGKIIPVQAYFWQLLWQDIRMSELDRTMGRDRSDGAFLEDIIAKQQVLFNQPENRFINELKGFQFELGIEKIFAKDSIQWMKANPGKTLLIKLENTWQFWIGAENRKKTLLLSIMQFAYLGAALVGLWLVWRYREIQKVKYGLLLILMLWAEHTVVFAWGRFSLDLVPVLGILFGLGVDAWMRQREGRTCLNKRAGLHSFPK